MSVYIPKELKEKVRERASFRCEYCLVHEDDMFFRFHIEHIVSLKHGGESTFENLANACSICNSNKGTDLGTFLLGNNRLIRFFNPRTDKWHHHFKIENGLILPNTKRGEATVKIFDFNNPDRIILRQLLIATGRYP